MNIYPIDSQLVSILIPMYNSENYIKETLVSCINQKHKNIEIIIVDDGSTDNSLKVVQQLCSQYSNLIKVYEQENRGACAARNLAYSKSSGEYIQYLDADDILSENKISDQLVLLKDYPSTTLSFCKWIHFKGEIINIYHRRNKTFKSYNRPLDWLIDTWMGKGASQTSCWLTNRELIDRAGKWDEELKKNQDGDFFTRTVLNASEIIYSPNSIVYYRIFDKRESISTTISESSCLSTIESFTNYQNYIEEYLPNIDVQIKTALACNYSHFYRYYYPRFPYILDLAEKRVNEQGFAKFIIPPDWPLSKLAKLIGFKSTVKLEKLIKKVLNK